MTTTDDELKAEVKTAYNRLAEERPNNGFCCLGKEESGFQPSYEDVEGHVPEADLGLGCGIPLEKDELKRGTTVLDLGSGAGNDCFVARRGVGSEGKVIGVDFSENMLMKARKNATDLDYNNVEFRQGEIESLPVTDASVDVVVSNCVLNLVPDKSLAFEEIMRVLKPGGFFSVSDVVLEGELPVALRDNVEMYAGCVAGAEQRDEYLAIIRKTGLESVEVLSERDLDVSEAVPESLSAGVGGCCEGPDINGEELAVKSITVRGYTPS